jgi:hypothetical protein
MFQKSRLTAEAFARKSGNSKFKEPFVDIGATLKPSAKTAQTMEPWIGALDDPAHFAKSASVRSPLRAIDVGMPTCNGRRYLS